MLVNDELDKRMKEFLWASPKDSFNLKIKINFMYLK